MNTHLTDQQLNAYLHQTLSDEQRETLDAHLTNCPACRAHLSDMSVLQQRLQRELAAELNAVNAPSSLTFETIALHLIHRRKSIMPIARLRNLTLFAVAASAIMMILAINLIIRTNLADAPATQPAASSTSTPAPTMGQRPINVEFGDFATLLGYDTGKFNPMGAFDITLYWQSRAKTRENYKVIVQVLDDQNNLIAQISVAPDKGNRPTMSWQPGEVIVEHYTVVQSDFGPHSTGPIKITVSLYDVDNGDYAITNDGSSSITLMTLVTVETDLK